MAGVWNGVICEVPTHPTHSVPHSSVVPWLCGHSWLSWQPVLLGTVPLLTEDTLAQLPVTGGDWSRFTGDCSVLQT